jgi:hypothetical protein
VSAFSPLAAVVRALHFQEDRRALLLEIPEPVWPALLHLTDEARLTLPLAIRCGNMLPRIAAERVQRSLWSNQQRHSRVVAGWREISHALVESRVEFAVLKGLTHWPFYSDDLAHRPQYDFDIYCPDESILKARDAIAALGYEALHPAGGPATDHLPAMIRKTGYMWTGDYFDPALPLSVELHYQFWDAGRESFGVRSTERFWERRTVRNAGDLTIPALHPVDCLSYATWHLVRHLVAGNLRIYHVYELAHFLHNTREQDSFWREWDVANSPRTGVAERIAFRLASEWFGCGMHPLVAESICHLPADVKRWFNLFAFSPVLALERLNKDDLFLHLSLVAGRRDKFRLAAKRVFPLQAPRMVLDAHTSSPHAPVKARRVAFRVKYIGKRILRHTKSLWPVGRSALRWWLARTL